VGSPDIVLADEPSGNLDTGSKNMLHELILQLNRELSTTFLIATHNEQLAGLGARTLHLSDGAVVREVHNSYAL
jgi:lipoprotein-releasing system ATP-binding protein